MICPTCGHSFRALRCQCRGFIHSAEAWKLGRWDWRSLYGAFSDGVRPMDVDFLVERNGHFLVFETKAPNVEIGLGQRRALEAMARLPQFTVAALWGAPDEAEALQECRNGAWLKAAPIDNTGLWQWSSDWWVSVNQRWRRRA